jgi:gluconokinase
LLDRRTAKWDATWLDALGVSADRLPRLDESAAPLDSARWPALRSVSVFPAIGDGAAANIGSGCVDDGALALTIGTTAAVRAVVREADRVLPLALWQYRVDAVRPLLGGATTEGGNVIAWVSESFGLDIAAASERFAATPPDAHGLTLLPTFAGERSPGYAEHASGALHGLRLETTAADILRAAIESISYRLTDVVEACAPLVKRDAPIVVSGGALLASRYWRQLLADLSGREIAVTDEAEASARGVAMLALHRMTGVDLASLSPVRRIAHTPSRAHIDVYHAARERQRALYRKLIAPAESGFMNSE